MSDESPDSLATTNPMEIEEETGQPPPKDQASVAPDDNGRRGSTKMRRPRPGIRRSLARLTSFPLTEVEREVKLPPKAYKDRKITDVLFLFLFFCYWLGMAAIGIVAFQNGHPASLIFGRDSAGRVCGEANEGFSVDDTRFAELNVQNDMTDKRFVVFPRTEKDLELNFANFEINLNPFDVDFFRVCASSCPQEGELTCTEEAEAIVLNHFETNPTEQRSREELINACVLNDRVRLFDAEVEECIDNSLAKQCFENFFNQSSFLFRCFPEFIYEVERLEDQTGCLEFRNTTNIGGNVIEDCVKFQEVRKITRIEPIDTSVVFEAFNSASRLFDRLLGDVINAGGVIIGTGFGVAGVTGLFYIMALRYFVGIVIWATVLFGVAMMFALTLFAYFKAGILTQDTVNDLTQGINDFSSGAIDLFTQDNEGDIKPLENETTVELPNFISESEDFETEFTIVAYILTALTLILIFVVIGSGARINRAIEFFKEAGRCIKANPQVLLMPIYSLVASTLVTGYYFSATVYITSSGTLENSSLTVQVLENLNVSNANEILEMKLFGPLENSSLLNVYLLVGYFWSMSFVSAVSLMTTSGVVAKWYWAGSPSNRSKSIKENNLKVSLTDSFATVARYHLGTAAFGSLLITFVQLIRYIAGFLQSRVNNTTGNNNCVRLVFLALHCCLKCAENCVKFISHNAYYMAVLYGTSFCDSTKMAFSAFANNLIQVATVTFLGDIILRFGQIFVVSVAAFVSYVTFDGSREFQLGGEKELSSFIFPVFLTTLLSWFVANEVLSIYHVAIDTILLSYCQDKKLLAKRGDARRSMKANEEIKEFVEKNKPTEEAFARQRSLAVYA